MLNTQGKHVIHKHIRAAIKASGKTHCLLSKETGVSESQLCQLMSKTEGLPVETFEVLATHFGLVITIQPARGNTRVGTFMPNTPWALG